MLGDAFLQIQWRGCSLHHADASTSGIACVYPQGGSFCHLGVVPGTHQQSSDEDGEGTRGWGGSPLRIRLIHFHPKLAVVDAGIVLRRAPVDKHVHRLSIRFENMEHNLMVIWTSMRGRMGEITGVITTGLAKHVDRIVVEY